jgi:hypothetical protein
MKKGVYDLNPILSSTIVLYLFLFIALSQVFLFLNTSDFASLIVLISTGIITTFFNKNMIVVLLFAVVVSNIAKYGIFGVRLNEGFEDSQELSKEEEEVSENSVDNLKKPVELKKKNGVKDKKVRVADDIETMKKPKSENNNESAKPMKNQQLNELKEEFPEFKNIQDEIIKGIKKINPLLQKAEKYMDKYENFNNNKEEFVESMKKGNDKKKHDK